jgi:hypothetical protein
MADGPKPALASKTMRVAILTTVVSVLALLQGEQWIAEYPQVVAVIGVAIGVVQVVLRTLTSRPVTWTRLMN